MEPASPVALQAVHDALQAGLGARLHALILYGDAVDGRYHPDYSRLDLLAIVADDLSLTELRPILHPLWATHGATLRQMPRVIHRSHLNRYLQLNPELAANLAESGQSLAGDASWLSAARPFGPAPPIGLASRAGEAAAVSALLAPRLLDAQQREALARRLNRLYWEILHDPVPDQSPAALLAAIYRQLETEAASLPEAAWLAEATPDPPSGLPELEAIYERGEEIVLVFPPPLAEQVTKVDWTAIANRLEHAYFGLRVTSGSLLRLVLQLIDPFGLALDDYAHAWGRDLLDGLSVPDADLFLTGARTAVTIQTTEWPHAYLTADDDQLLMLIHDYQNRLLNLHLQQELICRRRGQPIVKPPALPDRDVPRAERILAIDEQLEWWVAFYLAKVTVDAS